MGCTPSILTDRHQNRKDSGLFCVNIGRTSNATDNNMNGNETIIDTQNVICQQALINPYGKDVESGDLVDKRFVKKDSIVSVAGLGTFTGFTTVVRRATCIGVGGSERVGGYKENISITIKWKYWGNY